MPLSTVDSAELAVLIELGVHYDSDLKHVEGVASFDPFTRYHTFGESSIDFTVILRAQEFKDQVLVKLEFVKRLHERYKKEKIVIPFPIRTLDLPLGNRII